MAEATVKICGFRSMDVLPDIVKLPIDHIGFIFAKSRRQVTPAQAAEMIAYIRHEAERPPLMVGVFVDPDRETLARALDEAKLDVIQLHGDETAELCRWLKDTYSLQVIKVVPIYGGGEGEQRLDERLESFRGAIDAIMLDTHDPLLGGGTGKTFNWSVIPEYKEWAENAGIRLIAAGGLDSENVVSFIETYAPDGVDVSSGVETAGEKDAAKIKAFVERVKRS